MDGILDLCIIMVDISVSFHITGNKTLTYYTKVYSNACTELHLLGRVQNPASGFPPAVAFIPSEEHIK